MVHLLLAVACSTSIALILRLGEGRGYDRAAVLSANYLAATSISLGIIIGGGFFRSADLATTAGIGVPAGVLYFLGFLYYQKSVRESGVGLAGSFAKLGILVPMLLSVILWGELPVGLQWAGLVLALFAIGLVSLEPSGGRLLKGFHGPLILLFLFGGTAEFTNKLYQRYGELGTKDVFLLFVFGTALLVSLWRLLRSGRPPSGPEFLTGLLVGVPNYFASFFLIHALARLPASLAFPMYSAGSIALITIGGALLYRERLRGRELAAVLSAMTAMVLINA